MGKFNKGWNEPDSSVEEIFGPPQKDRSGADYGRRWNAPPSAYNGKGGIGYGSNETYGLLLGKPAAMKTPGLDTDPEVIKPTIESRGDCAYSSSDLSDVFGKPQRPGKA